MGRQTAQPRPVPGWEGKGQWYLQRNLQGVGFPPCLCDCALPASMQTPMDVHTCTLFLDRLWSTAVGRAGSAPLCHGGECCPSLDPHNQRSQEAVTGSGGLCLGGGHFPWKCPQLAFSLEAEGRAVQCQVTELQVKPLWLTRLGSSCCQSKWDAERGEISGAATC